MTIAKRRVKNGQPWLVSSAAAAATAAASTATARTATSGTATSGTATSGTATSGTATSGTATSRTATSRTATSRTATSRTAAAAGSAHTVRVDDLLGDLVVGVSDFLTNLIEQQHANGCGDAGENCVLDEVLTVRAMNQTADEGCQSMSV